MLSDIEIAEQAGLKSPGNIAAKVFEGRMEI